jgi:hypothetical protein
VIVLSNAALPAVIALVLHILSVVRSFALRAKNELQKEGKVPPQMTTYGHRVSPVI